MHYQALLNNPAKSQSTVLPIRGFSDGMPTFHLTQWRVYSGLDCAWRDVFQPVV